MTVVKSTVLGLGLLAGVAFAAQAQSPSGSVAALPPDAAAAPPAVAAPVAPSVEYLGPKPGGMWSAKEQQTREVTKSPDWIGPKPGGMWSATEQQTREVVPSGAYPGPRPH